ncbi:hypothetical protein B0O99DRAFT_681224 [Bisporella sp. PMI_857]|nr:hypothetical protein B0O99DRAFT_681224 [Bisporella sp. PMI_857]
MPSEIQPYQNHFCNKCHNRGYAGYRRPSEDDVYRPKCSECGEQMYLDVTYNHVERSYANDYYYGATSADIPRWRNAVWLIDSYGRAIKPAEGSRPSTPHTNIGGGTSPIRSDTGRPLTTYDSDEARQNSMSPGASDRSWMSQDTHSHNEGSIPPGPEFDTGAFPSRITHGSQVPKSHWDNADLGRYQRRGHDSPLRVSSHASSHPRDERHSSTTESYSGHGSVQGEGGPATRQSKLPMPVRKNSP